MENKNAQENQEEKIGFFKKVWYSIEKIEKYSDLSAEGFGKTLKYLIALMIILAVVSGLATTFNTSIKLRKAAKYIEENAPDFTYSENTLNIDSEEQPIINEGTELGKIIIDTKAEDEETINQYIYSINDEEDAIIILKDHLLFKQNGEEILTYTYDSLLQDIGITEFNKQQLVEYLTSSNMMTVYFNLFTVLFMYAFVIYLINALIYILLISIVGFLATLILRMKIRYVGIFNMAVYAVTLPTILEMIYIGINAFVNYSIPYFDVMYVVVASIYVIAAIFILKSDLTKQQQEVQKIVEVQKEVREELKEKEKEKEKNKEENKDTSKKDKENNKEEKKDENNEVEQTGEEQNEGSI